MMSEISQSININNITDLVEKFGTNTNHHPNESFGLLNRIGSNNSSFVSNGAFSRNNSFKMTGFSHLPENSIIKQANDKFFDGIDEEGHEAVRFNYPVGKQMEYGIREYVPPVSFHSYGNNSFKVNEPNSFLFKKPTYQVSPQVPQDRK